MKIEKSEMKNQERNRERKFSRGGSSSCKRTRESQVDSVHGLATRGKRQGPTVTQGSGRGISTGEEESPHYHKNHYGTCSTSNWGLF